MATQIGIVLCRVGAAVLVVQAIRSLGYVVPAIVSGFGGNWPGILASTLVFLVPGLAAIGLWVFAERICTLPGNNEQPVESSLEGADILRVGTALIGIYILVLGMIDGINLEVTNLMLPDPGAEYQRIVDESRARTAGSRAAYIAQLLLGMALIAGKDKISSALLKARYAAVKSS